MKDEILNLLKDEYDALDVMTIYDRLNLKNTEELGTLQNYLYELVDEMVLYQTKKNKYILYDKCPNFKKGKIDVKTTGNAFLLQDDKDIFISKKNVSFALDGDYVLVEVIKPETKNDLAEGRVIKILKRSEKNIVGVISRNKKGLIFVPNEKLNLELVIPKIDYENVVEGEIVVVVLLDAINKTKYNAHIAKKICHKDDANVDILTIAAKHDIFAPFSDETMEELESIPNSVSKADLVSRVDLRDKVIFTIDGCDTKDIDDAISLDYKDDNYVLGVHIADVSYYVKYKTSLDKDAYERGTSSYLAYSVIPMLPHKLSNGICSLNELEDRCAITCEMIINEKGKVIDYDIFPSVIKSKKKMNYDCVNEILMKNIIPEGYEEFADTLKNMNELAHIIRAERTKRGASDFDITEAKIICDEKGKAIDIKKRERYDAERMIEDFMIAANETVARHFINNDKPGIFRVHDTPKPEKISAFINFCNANGKQIRGKFTNINPHTFQKLLSELKLDEKEAPLYKSLAVRSMPKAYYSYENIGHFGLASRNYTHFTSPIRRYPDLFTHRLIREFFFSNNNTEEYFQGVLPDVCKQSSDRELKAVEAEREVDKVKMAEYMESHVGETFKGMVSGVQEYGLFIQLDNLVEGLLSVEELNDDYYIYQEDVMRLIGRKTNKIYKIGDEIEVKCIQANKFNGQIDFSLK